MPDPTPTPEPTAVSLPLAREPLDPIDPAAGQVCEDLCGWDTLRLEAVFETLLRSDIDHAWQDGRELVFHDADRAAVDEVLDRFRDAPWHEITDLLDRYWDEDTYEEEEEGV
jgi:hypothetical protein